MSAEVKKEIELEIAHVLFLDIVGYSKRSVNEQHAQVEELNEIVRLCEQFRKAEAASRLLKIPTGDGMALVFYKSPEEPAQCAVEISRALKDNARLQVRMGIHSGPVSGVVDVNERTNVAGGGINTAQRVMDCGDSGHILLSRHVAEDLAEYDRWRPFLHDIGTFEVKHGVPVSVSNLYSDEIGNAKLPTKLQAVRKRRAHVRWAEIGAALIVLGAIIAGVLFFARGPTTSALRVLDKSIAVLPFENRSEDKANAYFTDGVQDEILTDLAKIAIEQPPTTDLAAFDLYSRAKSLVLTAGFSATSAPDLRKAIELLDEAVKRDPSFFDAYCQLAFAHEFLYAVRGSDHSLVWLALAAARL